MFWAISLQTAQFVEFTDKRSFSLMKWQSLHWVYEWLYYSVYDSIQQEWINNIKTNCKISLVQFPVKRTLYVFINQKTSWGLPSLVNKLQWKKIYWNYLYTYHWLMIISPHGRWKLVELWMSDSEHWRMKKHSKIKVFAWGQQIILHHLRLEIDEFPWLMHFSFFSVMFMCHNALH